MHNGPGVCKVVDTKQEQQPERASRKARKMSEATMTKTRKMQIANTILRQISPLVRGCLDMKGSSCLATDSGLKAVNVIVGPRKRGNIEITLNSADLYDIKVTRNTIRDGETILEEWEDVYCDQLSSILDSLWR